MLSCIFIHSQEIQECINEVSTNPDAPTNSNLPNSTIPGYDQLFLNKFDWIPRNSAGNIVDLQTIGLSHLGAQQSMRPLYDHPLGFSQYYSYLNDEVVMTANLQGGMNQGLLLPNGEINNIYSDQTTDYYKYLSNEIEPSSQNINSVKTRKNQNETKPPIYHLSLLI
jgi:hypothetical protein